ncbi:uncharacterized protein LOC122064377 [Macadamia integrifolia]|uniref:uncharacterized protein LOC122064377 n=1 Tax=Macadamia integrifolia TaxID=60698 RepID=UPI001C501CC1|nr:uncharacterized protein LOC122064377 [Macadamia integrifolia]
MRQRVHAILWLKELEEEEEKKLGHPLDDSVELLLDACPEVIETRFKRKPDTKESDHQNGSALWLKGSFMEENKKSPISSSYLMYISERLVSSSKESQLGDQNPFVVSYLISSCGFSPGAAISASKKIVFESSDKLDSVLTLFRSHGFTKPQISSLIRKYPSLLIASATKTLLPKLQFFHSVGVSNANIAKILAKYPRPSFYSLENKIIPVFNFFKSLVGTVENVVIVLKRESRLINCDIENVARNIAILRENGVPETKIMSLLTYFPCTMTHEHDRFKQMAEEIKKMGIEPSKYLFVIALYVLTSVNISTQKQKFEAYRKWGFYEDELLMAFRRYPWFIK